MKIISQTLFLTSLFLLFSCEQIVREPVVVDPDPDPPITNPEISTVIANDSVAFETVLRSIPDEYINLARQNLHVAFQHTSHGTQVTRGLFGLPDYKDGDLAKFAVTRNDPQNDKLDIRDNPIEYYAEGDADATDLSDDETAFIQATRNYLDDPENEEINVVMWAWCDIDYRDIEGNYLPGMQTLIDEYGPGGSKIGTGDGQRATPVDFIFMTSHAYRNDNIGEGKAENQADLIIDYCRKNNYYCLDFYSIDTHDMDGNYWEDAGEDGNSPTGGHFFLDWQNSHELGTDYYEARSSPGGSVKFGGHNTQHISSNRKAYAMWYLLARIAGWDGTS